MKGVGGGGEGDGRTIDGHHTVSLTSPLASLAREGKSVAGIESFDIYSSSICKNPALEVYGHCRLLLP